MINSIPPNMDITCTITGSSTVCVDPWNYYKGYVTDLTLIVIMMLGVTALLLKK